MSRLSVLSGVSHCKCIVTEPPPGKGAVCCILRGDCSGEPDALAAVVRGWDRTFLCPIETYNILLRFVSVLLCVSGGGESLVKRNNQKDGPTVQIV